MLKLVILMGLALIIIMLLIMFVAIEQMKQEQKPVKVFHIYKGHRISEEEAKLLHLYAYECEKDIICFYYRLK